MKFDQILQENAYLGFHEAGENVDKSLNLWKNDYEKLNAQKNSLTDISSSLTSAIDAIP